MLRRSPNRLNDGSITTGAQPMSADHDGALAAVVTYSGEIYNFRELRDELRGLGHQFRTTSDTEVLLRAYLQWGESFVDRLNGMFAFGLWDPRERALLLVRDRMGIKPLYYHPMPDGVVFASEPKGLLAHPSVSAVVDNDGLRELLTTVKTPGHGIYQGMREVRPGEIVRIDASGLHARRYWRLEAREHTDDLPTTIRTVRELLDDIVTQPDEMRETSDTPFVHDVAEHVSADHTDIVLDSPALMDPLYRTEVVHASDLPSAMGDMYTSLYLLFRAVRERSTVALSGESADEVFGGYTWFHDPAVVAAETFPWLATLQVLAGETADPAETLFTPDLTAKLDLNGYRDAAYRQALAEVDHLPDESPVEHRMREIFYLNLTRFVQILLDRKDRMSMAHGLEVRVPFCDHRLVGYVYNTPWAMKTADGREKSLLRAAAADVLPASVVARKKSPYPSTQDPAYEQMLRDRLRALLDDSGSPLLPLLDPKSARALTEGAYEGNSFAPMRRGIEMTLSLNEWLSRYPVRLAVG